MLGGIWLLATLFAIHRALFFCGLPARFYTLLETYLFQCALTGWGVMSACLTYPSAGSETLLIIWCFGAGIFGSMWCLFCLKQTITFCLTRKYTSRVVLKRLLQSLEEVGEDAICWTLRHNKSTFKFMTDMYDGSASYSLNGLGYVVFAVSTNVQTLLKALRSVGKCNFLTITREGESIHLIMKREIMGFFTTRKETNVLADLKRDSEMKTLLDLERYAIKLSLPAKELLDIYEKFRGFESIKVDSDSSMISGESANQTKNITILQNNFLGIKWEVKQAGQYPLDMNPLKVWKKCAKMTEHVQLYLFKNNDLAITFDVYRGGTVTYNFIKKWVRESSPEQQVVSTAAHVRTAQGLVERRVFEIERFTARQSNHPVPVRLQPRPLPIVQFGATVHGLSKALKLGAKNVSDDAFVEKLRSEGQTVSDMKKLNISSSSRPAPEENLNREAVLVKLTEKLVASVSRNGGVDSADILGSISVNISDSNFVTSALKIATNPDKTLQMQVHPNMDKKLWQSRQFLVFLTKSRLEGLLKAFPKLGTNIAQRQHTFVETDSVRYVYQPIDEIYVVLVTTKKSNILEDLEALRLFSRVVPEYCRSNDESEILNKAFELIFAFDEIVALGYRENVNLAMIRTYTEMDSHEERVHKQIVNAQMRDAISKGQQRAKELKTKKHDYDKRGLSSATAISSSNAAPYSSAVTIKLQQSAKLNNTANYCIVEDDKENTIGDKNDADPKKHDYDKRGLSSATAISSSNAAPYSCADRSLASSLMDSIASRPSAGMSAPVGRSKALKLGAKNVSDDAFVEKLRSEGQTVSDMKKLNISSSSRPAPEENLNREAVLVKLTEKLVASVSRNGGVDSADILGSISVNINDSNFVTSALKITTNPDKTLQMQVHPNMDKKLWQSQTVLKLKSADKTYPLNTDVGLLKWRMSIEDEEELPLTLNVFPDETPDGCTVNIEYNLKDADLTLNEVVVHIPLPPAAQPTVSDVVGNYEYIRSKSLLKWTIPLIDKTSDVGNLEFSVPNGHSDHFFPVNIEFWSEKLFSGYAVAAATDYEGKSDCKYTASYQFVTEKYEIV